MPSIVVILSGIFGFLVWIFAWATIIGNTTEKDLQGKWPKWLVWTTAFLEFYVAVCGPFIVAAILAGVRWLPLQ